MAPLHGRLRVTSVLRVAPAISKIGDLHHRLEGLKIERSVEEICS